VSRSALEQPLRDEWRTLCAALAVPEAPAQALGERLLRAWRRWPRRYHDTTHLAACIRAARELRNELGSPEAVAWALWFHDAVYWPWHHDNEERSADWARSAAQSLGLSADFGDRVHALVMVTAHGRVPAPSDRDAEWLVDIDLGVLGQPRDAYERYAADVRREYFWVPGGLWRRGRAAVLQQFLDQPSVYRTTWFRDRFEAAARDNLRHELSQLEG